MKSYLKLSLYTFVIFVLLSLVKPQDYIEELKILNDTLNSKIYNKNLRPSSVVDIYMILNFIQVVSIDEKSQIMTSSSYLTLVWNDTRLSWDPAKYFNMTDLNVPVKKIWIPDIANINSADGDGFLKYNDFNMATITHDGFVFATISLNILKTKCKIDIKKFPFDSQWCDINFGSWSQDDSRINIIIGSENIKTDDYSENSVWKLVNSTVTLLKTKQRIPSFLSKYNMRIEELQFSFKLLRRPLYFMINGIFPCLILNCLTLFFFFLPYTAQLSLSMTSILTFSVYSLRISSDIPIQSEYLPIIGFYFIFAITFISIAFIWFIILNKFHDKKSIPKYMEAYANNFRGFIDSFENLRCFKSKNKNSIEPKETVVEVVTVYCGDECTSQDENYNNFEKENGLNKQENHKCTKCDLCKECLKEKHEENKRTKDLEALGLNLTVLNITAFFTIFIATLIVNLFVWLTLSIK